jgi:hypothetical protein
MMTPLLFSFFQFKLILFKFFFIFIIICLAIFDILFNIRDLIFNFKKYWTSDPFAFRFQQLLVFPIVIVEILEIGWFWDGKRCLDNRLYVILTSLFYRIFIILYFSGFVLILTGLKKFLELFDNKIEMDLDNIDEIFYDEEKLRIFQEHVQKEFSNENLLLYQDIKIYQKSNLEDRKIMANHIYQKYLNGNLSELEANVPGRKTREILKHIKNEHFEVDLFNEVLLTVKENLSDSYSRFILSEIFLNYENSSQIVKEHLSSETELFRLLPKISSKSFSQVDLTKDVLE